MKVPTTLLLAGIMLLLPMIATAQDSVASDFRDDFLAKFQQSSRKLTSLSEVVPEDKYTWSPSEGVMSIAQAYMHIARYNFAYLEDQLGIEAPEDIDVENLEEITDKETVRALLERSIEHVRTTVPKMSEEDLMRRTELYGRDTPGWGVLFQLLAHMNEHVGQSVTYARVNGIVPPWSRQAN